MVVDRCFSIQMISCHRAIKFAIRSRKVFGIIETPRRRFQIKMDLTRQLDDIKTLEHELNSLIEKSVDPSDGELVQRVAKLQEDQQKETFSTIWLLFFWDYRQTSQLFNSFSPNGSASSQMCEHVWVSRLLALVRLRSKEARASKSEKHTCSQKWEESKPLEEKELKNSTDFWLFLFSLLIIDWE